MKLSSKALALSFACLIVYGAFSLAFLNLDLLKKDGLELRDYQQRAAEKAVEKSLLVVMPTALGKTFVAVLAIAHLLSTQKKLKDGGTVSRSATLMATELLTLLQEIMALTRGLRLHLRNL